MTVKPYAPWRRDPTSITRLLPRLEHIARVHDSLWRDNRLDRIRAVITYLPIDGAVIELNGGYSASRTAVVERWGSLDSN